MSKMSFASITFTFRTVIGLVVVCAVNIALVMLALSAGRAGQSWEIAFNWTDNAQREQIVELLDADRGIRLRLFRDMTFDSQALARMSVSPDHQRILWWVNTRSHYYDAPNRLHLRPDELMAAIAHPIWASDGRSLIYQDHFGTIFDAAVADDGRLVQEPLLDRAFIDQAEDVSWSFHQPTLSPDNRWVAFSVISPESAAFEQYDIYAVERESRELLNLTGDQDHPASSPIWMPDASGLIYLSSVLDADLDQWRFELWMLHMQTGEHRLLVPLGISVFTYRLPNNTQLVVGDRRPEGGFDIYLVDAETAEVTGPINTFTMLGDSVLSSVWSPDGEWIAYADTHQGQSDIVAVHLESGTRRQLTNDDRVEILMR
jgi:Tol biopolymer transport system component